jgi:hypothetical protein
VNHGLNPIGIHVSQLFDQTDYSAELVRELQRLGWAQRKPCEICNPNHILGSQSHEWTSELLWQRKGFGSNGLSNATATNALGTNSDRSHLSIRQRNLAVLQVWGEPPLGDTSNLGTYAAQVLSFSSDFNLVTDGCYFSANFTSLGHDLP